MQKFKAWMLTTLVVLAVVVIFQNTQEVETKILFVTVKMPRAFLLLLTCAIGFAAGCIATMRTKSK